MTENHTIKTPHEWIMLAELGKEEWNQQVALLTGSIDFIDFREAKTSIPLSFAGFKFPVKVDFTSAKFSDEVDFSHAVFESDAVFTDAEFYDKVTFHGAKFNGDASFKRTQFKDEAQFRNAKFKTGVYFDNAKFKGYAVFHGVVFSGAAYFEGATFGWAPLFKGEDMHGNIRFNAPSDFDKQFLDKGEESRVPHCGEEKNDAVAKNHAIANYRELKLAMKRIESHAEENAFFRLEMIARKNRETRTARKLLYRLYEFASDYGQSIARPLGWFVAFFGIFFGLYWVFPQLLGFESRPDDHISNALLLAMQKASVFPGMFSGDLRDCIKLSELGIALAGVHWLLSAASLFLLLLGFRNLFRLK